MKRLYVGNLSPATSAEEVRVAFSKFGAVISVSLAEDLHSGNLRGFGYVEMEDGGEAAIAGLNRTDLGGKPLTVCGAQPRKPEAGPAPLAIRRTESRSSVG